jgi:hypothetical protein
MYSYAKVEQKARYLSFQRVDDGELCASVMHREVDEEYCIPLKVTIGSRLVPVLSPTSQIAAAGGRRTDTLPFSSRMADELIAQRRELERQCALFRMRKTEIRTDDVTETPKREYPWIRGDAAAEAKRETWQERYEGRRK